MDQRVSPGPIMMGVDDDPAVRRALAFALYLEGVAVETFEAGEALLLRDPREGPRCGVLDERPPGVSVLNPVRPLRARAIALPALLVTSHPNAAFREAAAQAGAPILEKPLMGETLAAAIRDALESTAS